MADDATRVFLVGTGGVFFAEALGWWAVLAMLGIALLIAAHDGERQ